jgi:antitoxin component HigA of HigAB toxin-antitoxin module
MHEIMNEFRRYPLHELEDMLNNQHDIPTFDADRKVIMAALIEVIKEKRTLLSRMTPL